MGSTYSKNNSEASYKSGSNLREMDLRNSQYDKINSVSQIQNHNSSLNSQSLSNYKLQTRERNVYKVPASYTPKYNQEYFAVNNKIISNSQYNTPNKAYNTPQNYYSEYKPINNYMKDDVRRVLDFNITENKKQNFPQPEKSYNVLNNSIKKVDPICCRQSNEFK